MFKDFSVNFSFDRNKFIINLDFIESEIIKRTK